MLLSEAFCVEMLCKRCIQDILLLSFSMQLMESHSDVTCLLHYLIRDILSRCTLCSRSIDIPPCGFLYAQEEHGEVLLLRHCMHIQEQSN